MKDILNTYLPASIAHSIIAIARWLKKIHRHVLRYARFGTKPILKQIRISESTFLIQLKPINNGCVDETIAREGRWEEQLTKQLTKHLKPGDVFLDIGANIGFHSLLVSSLHNRAITVHAFEPLPTLFNQLTESKRKNHFSNLTIHNFGLGDKEREMQIFVRDENMGGSSLFEYKNLNLVRPSETQTIQIKTLDSVFSTNSPISVIKIDVEGYEFEALKGAEKLLRLNAPLIFMEFSPMMYEEDYAGKTSDFITYLTDLHYTFYTLDNEKIDLQKWFTETQNITQLDILCKIS